MTIPFALAAALSCALLQGCERAAEVTGAAQSEHGQRLLAQYQCGSCHSIPGVAAARGNIGPPLERWGGRSYIAGQIPNGPVALARWIASPQALVPGTLMPDMGVSEGDARAIAAYLMSLK